MEKNSARLSVCLNQFFSTMGCAVNHFQQVCQQSAQTRGRTRSFWAKRHFLNLQYVDLLLAVLWKHSKRKRNIVAPLPAVWQSYLFGVHAVCMWRMCLYLVVSFVFTWETTKDRRKRACQCVISYKFAFMHKTNSCKHVRPFQHIIRSILSNMHTQQVNTIVVDMFSSWACPLLSTSHYLTQKWSIFFLNHFWA